MSNQRFCPVCGANGLNTSHLERLIDHEGWSKKKLGFAYLRCKNCSSLFNDRYLSQEEIASFYPSDYMNRNNLSALFISFRSLEEYLHKYNLRKILTQLKKRNGVVKFLDYGAGNSTLSRIIGSNNSRINSKSYDPFLDIGSRRTSNLLSTQDFEAYNDINIITLVHVIEHLQNPDEIISFLYKKLDADGLIVIITPNVSDSSFRIFKNFWCFLHYPYHLTLFNSDSLNMFLAKNHFKLISSKYIFAGNTLAYSVDNLMKSFLRLNSAGHTRFYPALVLFFAPLEFLLWRLGFLKSVQMKVAQKIN